MRFELVSLKNPSEVYDNIRKAVYSVRLVDTHEHLGQERERLASKPDLFETFLAHYE